MLVAAPLLLTAQDAQGATTPAPVTDSEKLRLSTSPFIWLTSFDGTLGVSGVEHDISVTFSDIVDNSDSIGALTGSLDLEYSRLIFQINAVWSKVDISNNRTAFQNVRISADIDQEASWTEVFGGYRFIDKSLGTDSNPLRRIALDGFVGMRVTIIDVETHLRAQAMVTLPGGRVLEAGVSQTIDQTEAWVEPFLGARVLYVIDDHWILSVKGDVGGFGVDDSEFSWGALGLLGYRWRLDGWDIALYGGYRAIGQDYSDHEFKWDVITHGPVVGAVFQFFF